MKLTVTYGSAKVVLRRESFQLSVSGGRDWINVMIMIKPTESLKHWFVSANSEWSKYRF